MVEFYYLWKKTPQAASTRFHRRHRRQSVLRRIRTSAVVPDSAPKEAAPTSVTPSDPNELSSVSEEESDDDSRDLSSYSCQHCFATSSRDWHHAGKDRLLLCYECRVYLKKNGELRPLSESRSSESAAPFLFKPVKEDENGSSAVANGKHVMRTRRSKESGTKGKKSDAGSVSPEPDRDLTPNGKKSPSNGTATPKKPLVDMSNSPKGKKRARDSDKLSGEAGDENADDKAAVDGSVPSKKRKATGGSAARSPSSPTDDANSGDDTANNELENEAPNDGASVKSPTSLADAPAGSTQLASSPAANDADEKVRPKQEHESDASAFAASKADPNAPLIDSTPYPGALAAEAAAVARFDLQDRPLDEDEPLKRLTETVKQFSVPESASQRAVRDQSADRFDADKHDRDSAKSPGVKLHPPLDAPYSALPPCPPLITPKVEPPSSPPQTKYSAADRSQSSSANAESNEEVPLLRGNASVSQSPSLVRVKEEHMPNSVFGGGGSNKSPPPAHLMRPSSPESNRSLHPFGFMPPRPSPLPLGNLSSSQMPQLSSTREPSETKSASRDDARSKTPKEQHRSSASPRERPRSPTQASAIGGHPFSTTPVSVARSEPSPSVSVSSGVPTEHRLPPGMGGHPFAPGHPLAPHALPPGFPYPPVLPPGMSPYFPQHWYAAAAASRSIPPSPFGFPPAMPPISSASGPLTPKPKSPVTSQSGHPSASSALGSAHPFSLPGHMPSHMNPMFPGMPPSRPEARDHSAHEREKAEREKAEKERHEPEEEEPDPTPVITRGPR